MSTSQDQISQLLAQLQQPQALGAPAADTPSPMTPQQNAPLLAQMGMPQGGSMGGVPPNLAAMLGMQAPPVPVKPPTNHDALKETISNSANTFLYTLGQALSASAEHKGPGATNAGMGAAFTAPFQMQQMKLAQQQAMQKANLEAAQASKANTQADQMKQLLDSLQQKNESVANKNNSQANQADVESQLIPVYDSKGTLLGKFPTKEAVALQKTQMQTQGRLQVIGEKNAAMLRMAGIDPTTHEALPPDQTSSLIRAKIAQIGASKDMDEATAGLRKAQADDEPAKMKMYADRTSAIIQNALMGQEMRRESLDLREQQANQPKPTQALTNQSAAADRTLEMTKIVRDLVAKNPKLIGPVLGRINQAGQVVGGNPLANADDERDAATLAGHLAYLFANEVQGTMTGRPNPSIVQALKAASAQQKDDPAVLEGFLRSADNNAKIAQKVGADYGVKKGGAAPPAPPQVIPVNPKTNKPYAVGDVAPNGKRIIAINAKGPVFQP